MLLASRSEIARLTVRELLELTSERFAEVFRGTPIKRLKLIGLLRNACVVAGNSRDGTLLPAVLALASHPAPTVRAHAVWAVFQLAGDARAEELLVAARGAESDASVLAEYAAR